MGKIKIIERIGIWFSIGFSVLFVTSLFIAQYPDWWKWIIFERTPMTWLEFTWLYTAGLLALGSAILSFLNQEKKETILFCLLGFGFIGLSIDERFAIHERIRDNIFAPRNIRLPWTKGGDFLLLLVLIIGIIFFIKILPMLKIRKSSFICFLIGVLLAAIAVIMDSFDVHQFSMTFQRTAQFIEEIFEVAAQLFFMNSVFLLFTHKLKESLKMIRGSSLD